MRKLLILAFAIMVLPNISFSYDITKDTIKTKSGLKYIVLKKGSGKEALAGKMVSVHYEGWLSSNGKRFDSSRRRRAPIEFLLGAGHVIKGWDEGIDLMRVGDNFKLIIPPHLAYGEKGQGDIIPDNETLIFEVELMDVMDPKIPITDTLYYTITTAGLDAGKTLYNEMKADPKKYWIKEDQLNGLGYKFIEERKYDEALAVLLWNTEDYPESFNVWDSLGEVYMWKGDKPNAIKYYEKSIEINPENEAGKRMLVQLRGY